MFLMANIGNKKLLWSKLRTIVYFYSTFVFLTRTSPFFLLKCPPISFTLEGVSKSTKTLKTLQ
jgi:hypothetical protein